MWRPMKNARRMWTGEDMGGGSAPQVPPPPAAGQAPPYVERSQYRKSPALAAFLSIFPGLGQVYVGYYAIGFLHVLITASLITMLSSGAARGVEPLFGVFLAFFWLYNLVDANRRANQYNRALEGNRGQVLDDLPDPLPGPVFGIGLIVFGVIALMGTRFDFDFYWMREWWPLFVIAAGVWITWRNRVERRL